MKRVALVMMVFCDCAFARTDCNVTVTNRASALVAERGALNAAFTNNLSMWVERIAQ